MSHHHIFLFQCTTIHGCARQCDNPNSICQSMDGSYFVEGHQHQLFPLHSCIALTATFRHHCKNDVYRTTIKPSFFVAPLATTFAIIPHTHFSWARRLHTLVCLIQEHVRLFSLKKNPPCALLLSPVRLIKFQKKNFKKKFQKKEKFFICFMKLEVA